MLRESQRRQAAARSIRGFSFRKRSPSGAGVTWEIRRLTRRVSGRNRRRLCAYCGKAKKLTLEHVPPKLFLEQPFPKNLMTVPACGGCNQSFKADDEYTRTVLAVDIRANWNNAAQFNLQAILRSLQRPNARGFAEYLRSQSNATWILSAAGVPYIAIDLDNQRVKNTGLHIIRGLYFRETGKRWLCWHSV